jgi:hypothetical protein
MAYTASGVRVLFLVPWPSDAASTRLRVEQYLPYLRAQGVEPVVRPFMSPALYRMVYKPGHTARKIAHVLASALRRLPDVIRASRADLVVVHREALPIGTTLLERTIAALGTPMVCHLSANEQQPEQLHALAQAPQQGRAADPTQPRRDRGQSALETVRPAVQPERRRHSDARGHLRVPTHHSAQNRQPAHHRLGRQRHHLALSRPRGTPSRAAPRKTPRATELDMLHRFDIGLMPYPNNEWALGKCAFKALLYMSVGVPAVCSAVGMVEDVIDSGRTGYLAHSEDEWFEILDMLVSDRALRTQVGQAGREVATNEYSLERWAPRLLEVLQSAALGRSTIQEEVEAKSLARS